MNNRDILDEWRDQNSFSPEQLIEEDIPLKDVAEEVGDWGEERKLNFILDLLNGKERNRDNSFGDKLTKALTSVTRLKRANRLHKKKLDYIENQD